MSASSSAWSLCGLSHQFGRIEFEDLINKATDVLRGRPLADLEQIGERLFLEKIEKRIYPEMRDLVQAHRERGHTVVLSSSALTIQVDPVAQFLGIPNTLSNIFEVDDDGVLTGKVVKPIIWGRGQGQRRAEVRCRAGYRSGRQLLLRRR